MAQSGKGIEPAVVDDIIKRLLDFRIARTPRQVKLSEAEIRSICNAAREIFLQQPNLLELEAPIKICDAGLVCDLLWSDPSRETKGWGMNDRGVSYTFGADKVAEFLMQHDMDLVCRAHQVVEDGYEFFAERQLVTIFSAPNYCGEFDNAGAMMSVDESLMCSFQILKPTNKRVGFL
ncbi:unnamed protein product [Cuscuta epithymum]|uniref:protein-serine/threonine phosphatase n=1 Tax=Cuscuta epithymum TaxID=186058 RepID=A0AAV0CAC1_9ASTE|nr:unnamed protein product [Cuscuta epithymum]